MTDRRTFLKNTIWSSAGLIILPLLSFDNDNINVAKTADELEQGFFTPPSTAKPQAYWMWMNGHITKEGISLDLEMMKNIGLAGAFIYNTGTGIIKGPVEYGSDEWNGMLLHAMNEAQRLGLELFIHNSPGYSSTGGSWVSPQMSMQQLVWSEMLVSSDGFINIQLPQPYKKLDYYRDAFVIAYPTLGVERRTMRDELAHLYVNGKEIDKTTLVDNNPETKIKLENRGAVVDVLLLEFFKPFEARAITINRVPEHSPFVYDDIYDHPPSFLLEYSDDGNNFQTIGTINMPLVRSISAPGSKNFPTVKAKYFRLTANIETWISDIELHGSQRLAGWPGKINATDIDKITEVQAIENEHIIDPDTVINITDKLQANGRLVWNAPKGDWTILRFGHTCAGATTISAPDVASGLEIDKFSKEAVAFYFETFLNQLFLKLKPFTGNAFQGILIDSYEIGKQNWTSGFPLEFKQRRAYDMVEWLPALTGRIVKTIAATEKFLWDVRRTHADLMADNYYGQFKRRCSEMGLQFYAQPYGDGVFDSLQVGEHLDTPMAEFWTRYVPGTMNICKEVVSIAHGYGKKIISAEAFTGMPATSRWTEYPYALKSHGDHIYFQGINRFVFHVFVHQPYTTGFPGMSMGPYGTHFDRNLTWIKQAKVWIDYLSRTQFLLQQGVYVADVCYFKGEDPTTTIPDINYVDPPTPRNLAGDVIGPDVLLKRIMIRSNRIVLPDGMSYSILIMASLKSISFEVLIKLKQLVTEGMRLVVTSKPINSPGLKDDLAGNERINNIANELWGSLDGVTIRERSFGKGKIYWNEPLPEVLKQHNIRSDFEFTSKNGDAGIHYTHRRVGETEIYFISNHFRRKENIVGSFRVAQKTPEIWNPETGEIFNAAVYEFVDGRTNLSLTFEPAGSLFVIFRSRADDKPFLSVSKNGSEIISAKPHPIVKSKPFSDVANNFTIALWAKPDTYAYPGKSVLIFPPEAEIIYGKGHAASGLAAGQNGVWVFEKQKGANRDAQLMIKTEVALEGWTHLVVQYRDGKPSLFINGVLSGSHEGSGKITHPGLNTPPTDELFSAAFEGNYTKPKLYKRVLSKDEIELQFKEGLPGVELPFSVAIKKTTETHYEAVFWENGSYEFKSATQGRLINVKECKTWTIKTPWNIEFPSNLGAPSSIRLAKLISLHKHSEFNIRHFSGTAVYFTSFKVEENFAKDKKILLHLGRVETVAEVKLNGKNLGILWKEPYQVDVTQTIQKGINKLEVLVTTLWPNRMIGDEYLPKENDYDASGLITKLPDWYVNNKPKPGQRITFSTWNNFKKTDPLLESGLLGPVQLIIGVEKILE